MSNYKAYARPKGTTAPHTFVEVNMLDDYFGHHIYGVEFPDGTVLKEEQCDFQEVPRETKQVINRLEVINHSVKLKNADTGRMLVIWEKGIEITSSLQDDGRTLKVFIRDI